MNIVSTANAERYMWGEGCGGWHLLRSPGLSIIQERVPSGKGEVRHYHEKAEQFFYVLSGIATMETDKGVFEIGPDHGMHIAPGISHRLSNRGESDLVFLVCSAPMAHGDRVII